MTTYETLCEKGIISREDLFLIDICIKMRELAKKIQYTKFNDKFRRQYLQVMQEYKPFYVLACESKNKFVCAEVRSTRNYLLKYDRWMRVEASLEK